MDPADSDPLGFMVHGTPAEIDSFTHDLIPKERGEWRWMWSKQGRRAQLAPAGDWRVWLMMAGRGFGKTRAGAEWVASVALAHTGARIALVAANLGEARAVMVEGPSGLASVEAPWRRPKFEPSLRRLTWDNGAQATLYSAAEPESLRGPQHSHARRAGAEGGLRQRGPRADRCAAPLRDRGRGGRAASRSRGRRLLAGRRSGRRRLGRPGRPDRLPPGRQLAVRGASRRHADT